MSVLKTNNFNHVFIDIMCYYSILVFDDENVETHYVTNVSTEENYFS